MFVVCVFGLFCSVDVFGYMCQVVVLIQIVLVLVCFCFWENSFLGCFVWCFCMFVCVFGVFGVVDSSSRAKAGDAEEGIVLCVSRCFCWGFWFIFF